ncbi:MAG: hypothetical protein KJ732_01500 [Candidatus Margulisbacteria bacterium]|nr:hypothetical protein [Candidatus Margulisiibacteriota bacterium]
MKYLKYLLLAVVVLIIIYSYFATIAPSGPRVSVKKHPDYKETTYSIIDLNGQTISLTTYQTELNKGILRLRSNSTLPLEQQIALLSKILVRVLKDENKAELHALSIGRLLYAFGQDKTMSERLALAAEKSLLWDKTTGKPVSGHENNAVVKLANTAMIYPELKELFAKHGLALEFASAEKVLISNELKPPAKLPYDCLTWFSIK